MDSSGVNSITKTTLDCSNRSFLPSIRESWVREMSGKSRRKKGKVNILCCMMHEFSSTCSCMFLQIIILSVFLLISLICSRAVEREFFLSSFILLSYFSRLLRKVFKRFFTPFTLWTNEVFSLSTQKQTDGKIL